MRAAPVVSRVALSAIVLSLVACVHGARPLAAPSGPDAPYDLADEADFDLLRDRFWAMSPGRDRDDARRGLAGVLIERASAHLARDKQDLAAVDLLEAAGLFADDPDALGPALAAQVPALQRMQARFALAGADRETAATLVLLAATDPARADAYKAQLDEVLGFVDDLAASEHGEVARGAAPLATLKPIAHAFPARWLVDRYVHMLVARQIAVSTALDHGQATFDLVAAHRDVASSARLIAGVLARARRPAEIAGVIAPLHGIGEDPELVSLARHVAVAGGGSASDWVAFAKDLRDAKVGGDAEAAFAVAELARQKFGGDPTALATEAATAASLGRVEQAIALYEQVGARLPGDHELARKLAPLYGERLARLAESGRPNAARAELTRAEAFLDDADRHAGAAGPLRLERARLLVTAGKGLLGQGDVDAARDLLTRAVELAPDAEGFATLATIAIARERWGDARAWAERSVALPDRDPDAQFARARLLHLAGLAYQGAGDVRRARNADLEALREWADLGDKVELPPPLAGLRLVESGKVLWALGEHARAIDLLDAAMDSDDDGSNTYIAVVEFLLDQRELDHAADAVHRALGADGVSDYNKIYLCLYVVAEATGAGKAPDPIALDYLRNRQGTLWPDDLARLATGRADLATVSTRATTRARKAELAYYSAMLGAIATGRALDDAGKKRLFDRVIASDLITFFEYDMARRHERVAMAGAGAAAPR